MHSTFFLLISNVYSLRKSTFETGQSNVFEKKAYVCMHCIYTHLQLCAQVALYQLFENKVEYDSSGLHC